MTRRKIVLALAFGAGCALASTPVQWDTSVLFEAPQTYSAEDYVPGGASNGVNAVFLEGLPFKGNATRVFAYWGVPATASDANKVPGMVLVHGGGGSAFHRWVKFWNERGYAAIAMDLNGCVSGNAFGQEQKGHVRHPWAGPGAAGCGGFDLMKEATEDQWMYHSVAAVVRAHSFLRVQTGVDPARIGMTGVSWGGVVNCVVASVDDRLKFAAPVYGSGFLYEEFSSWSHRSGWTSSTVTQRRERWVPLWDPMHYLGAAKVPVHWLCGTNDENFSLPSVERSFDLVPQAKSLALRVRLAHSHSAVSEQAPEVLATADSLLGTGPARPALAKPVLDGDSVSAAVTADAGLPVVSASLDYTTDDCAIWYSNVWKSASATYGDGKVTATVPAGAKYFYLNVDTESAGRVSSRIMTAAELALAKCPYPRFTVDIPAGSSNGLDTVDSAAGAFRRITLDDGGTEVTNPVTRAEFLAAGGGSFLKTGDGTFSINESITGFGGQFHVFGGVLILTVKDGMGKCLSPLTEYPTDADGWFVHKGATLIMDANRYSDPNTAVSVFPAHKKITIEGRGFEGQGALVARMSNTKQGTMCYWPFGKTLALSGDARMINGVVQASGSASRLGLYTANTKRWTGVDQRILLNGHELEFFGADGLATPNFNQYGTALSDGTLTLSNLCYHLQNTPKQLGEGRVRVLDAASYLFLENPTMTQMVWPIETSQHGVIFRQTGGGAVENDSCYAMKRADGYGVLETNVFAYMGDIALGGNLRFLNPNTRLTGLSFNGALSGVGGVHQNSASQGKNVAIHLTNPNNTFRGGASVCDANAMLNLYRNGSLPADGGVLAVTNSTVNLLSGLVGYPDEEYELPEAVFHAGSTGVARILRGKGRFSGPVTKTGSGRLDYFSEVGGNFLDVRAGTVCFPVRRAGFNVHYFVGTADNSGYNLWKANSTAAYVTNSCALGAEEAYAPLSFNMWPRYAMRIYNGYIWNDSDETQRWTFAINFSRAAYFKLDGVEYMRMGGSKETYAEPQKATVELTPGPHQISLCLWAAASSGGCDETAVKTATAAGWTWAVGHGVMVDRQGRDSTNVNDYERLLDSGDGTFLSVSKDADEIAGQMPVFTKIRLGADSKSTVDLGGHVYCLNELVMGTKGGSFVNGSLTLNGRLTARAFDLVGKTLLSVDGTLSFGPSSSVFIENLSTLKRKPFKLLAAGQFDGLPTVEGGGWETKVDDDGDLCLCPEPRGLCVILK